MSDDLSSRLMGLFLDEMDERINTFDRDLLALETQLSDVERAERIGSLFRGAHSLKGAADSVGATAIATVCHGLEDLLAELRDGATQLDASRVELLFQTADALRDAAHCLRVGESASPALAALVQRLGASASRRPPSTAPTETPSQPFERQPKSAGSGPQPARPAASVSARESTVRVAADKLDALMQQSGELLVANHHAKERLGEALVLGEIVRQLRLDPAFRDRRGRGAQRASQRLRELDRALDRLTSALANNHAALQQAASRVDAEVRRIRMLPFATACEGLDRIVRDTARNTHKTAQLRLQGTEIELDRSISDGLRDPLVHLVRNAIDHGIENPQRRRAAGKPETGTVSIAAALRGEGIEITVADDGAGLDLPALRARARDRGFSIDEDDVASAVFLPGVSTARTITGLSGRGVGLDAVRTAVDAMRGTIRVRSAPDQGTSFVLTLPLTLTTLRVVLFELAGQTFALDAAIVQRVSRVRSAAIASVEGHPVITGETAPIPLIPFRAIFDLPALDTTSEHTAIIIIQAGDRNIALSVDALLDEREILIRSLGPRLSGVHTIAGATILADGTLALIARTAFLLERAGELTRTWRTSMAPKSSAPPPKRILLVDDSVTTRALERSILEAAEYEVITAGDGEEAWKTLAGTEVDLVVSDVDMPRMDGFALVEAMRASAQFRDIPIILVTARESDHDKRRGLEVGADAYVLKSGFDQRALLETIRQLL